tara:strand:- start:32 stop:1144 length:1113 start_codon:yes stop_codon:yes gene_type:complete
MIIHKHISAISHILPSLVCTAVEIFAVATQTADAGLILHSTMDNADVGAGAGTDDTGSGDFTVNNLVGSPNGTATETAGPQSVLSGATGIIGEALDFEGDGAPAGTRHVGYGDFYDHTNAPLGHTVSIWLNPDTSANGFPMAKGGSNPEAGWALFKVGNGLRMRGKPSAPAVSTLRDLRRSSGFEAGTWHHFAIVLDDVNFRLMGYVDTLGSGLSGTDNSWSIKSGSLNSYSSGEIWDSIDSLILGSISKAVIDYGFDGKLDDFAVWDEALTAGEVLGLYEVATNAVLNYNAAKFDSLKQIHDAASGTTAAIAGASGPDLFWTYASGLGSMEGLSGSSPSFTLVLNGSAGTGLASAAFVPSPAGTLVIVQ